MHIPHLPQEILEEILKCLGTDFKSLYACSTVSRRFREPSQRQLFSRLYFGDRLGLIDDYCDEKIATHLALHALSYSHRLCGYVRHVELAISCEAIAYLFFCKVMPFLSRVETLDLRGCSMTKIQTYPGVYRTTLPRVRRLYLTAFHNLSVTFLHQFPNLEFLDLDHVSFCGPLSSPETLVDGVERPRPAPVVVSLKPNLGSPPYFNHFMELVLFKDPSYGLDISKITVLVVDILQEGYQDYAQPEENLQTFELFHRLLAECAPNLEVLQIALNLQIAEFTRLLDEKPIDFQRLEDFRLVLPTRRRRSVHELELETVFHSLVRWIKRISATAALKRMRIHFDLVGRPREGEVIERLPIMEALEDLTGYWSKLETMPLISCGISYNNYMEDHRETRPGCPNGNLPLSDVKALHKRLDGLIRTKRFQILGARLPPLRKAYHYDDNYYPSGFRVGVNAWPATFAPIKLE
ncbi:hypothetical protein CC1G_05256 [Coprinopsis cinerea okayama7|uniref:F-box domain-containing protein n=1 Tax=Coprinopsis cinerea (strain Okayama-7 / 130 / ATCC MYA-4618 / FGSC 9003) TaxID=240176 RepID=A8PCD5_COPC7|nr:hypothetical protein CC1G_05256 [Coprinopsis cinerea okayama7\|eukprot:XP_001840370.2 hypothetical protein CC1G_05256 [Coprinopsis cinerea okayama7\